MKAINFKVYEAIDIESIERVAKKMKNMDKKVGVDPNSKIVSNIVLFEHKRKLSVARFGTIESAEEYAEELSCSQDTEHTLVGYETEDGHWIWTQLYHHGGQELTLPWSGDILAEVNEAKNSNDNSE